MKSPIMEQKADYDERYYILSNCYIIMEIQNSFNKTRDSTSSSHSHYEHE